MKQGVGGTKPKNIEEDKAHLINLINSFNGKFPQNENPRHPAFGYMNKKQWGRLIFTHLDHHLKQFNK
ncbi:MAG: DUF1569 domain-containing protein [Bacteroidetes bacterium]|nr:DUF1569 domain-containing protein [Bacteroidota bacterium]